MSGLTSSPILRLLIALLGLLLGVLSGGSDEPPDSGTPAAACVVNAGTPSPASGGLVQLVVEARPPAGVRITPETVCVARDIMAARLASDELDAKVTVAADYRVVVEMARDADLAAVTRQVTRVGLLEIVDPRGAMLPLGTLVTTSLGGPGDVLPPSAYAGEDLDDSAYETIVSGADIDDAYVARDQLVQPTVAFELSDDGADRIYAFTSANIGQPMAIVLDKRVISSPVIQDAISDTGIVTGPSEDEVEELVISLNTEPLPVPFEVVAIDGTPVESDDTPDAIDGTPVAASS